MICPNLAVNSACHAISRRTFSTFALTLEPFSDRHQKRSSPMRPFRPVSGYPSAANP